MTTTTRNEETTAAGATTGPAAVPTPIHSKEKVEKARCVRILVKSAVTAV